MVVQLRQGGSGGIEVGARVLVEVARGTGCAGLVSAIRVRYTLCLACMRAACGLLGRWSFARRGIDHEHKALLGRREFRDVVLWMRSADVLLHGAIPFFPDAALATAGAILVPQRTDDLIVGVGN